MGQANLWEVILQHEENADERPRKGWKIYERKPEGNEPITTRRGKPRKFKELEDVLTWVTENRRGYKVQIKCFGYRGSITPE
jgi:hypothetical protein